MADRQFDVRYSQAYSDALSTTLRLIDFTVRGELGRDLSLHGLFLD